MTQILFIAKDKVSLNILCLCSGSIGEGKCVGGDKGHLSLCVPLLFKLRKSRHFILID